MALPLTLHFRDRFTKKSTMKLYVADETDVSEGADLADLYAAIQACTAANLFKAVITEYELYTSAIPVLAVGEPYQNIEDKGYLEFISAALSTKAVSIPGCKAAMVAASDVEALDRDQTAVDELVTQIILFATTKLGEALVACWKAYRNRTRTRQPQRMVTA